MPLVTSLAPSLISSLSLSLSHGRIHSIQELTAYVCNVIDIIPVPDNSGFPGLLRNMLRRLLGRNHWNQSRRNHRRYSKEVLPLCLEVLEALSSSHSNSQWRGEVCEGLLLHLGMFYVTLWKCSTWYITIYIYTV